MKKKHLHFIGIKGVGMTALAIWAKEKGFLVTGSDLAEKFVTNEVLKRFKIPVREGFLNITTDTPDLVIVTGAHGGKTNPEAVSYSLKGVKVLTHGEALGKFMEGHYGISVSGVGGKTTTSAMLATILLKCNIDTSYVVGVGNIQPLNQPGHYGRAKYFVAEADEYASCPLTDRTPRFFYQHPKIAIITNIEFDHPDIYQSLEETKTIFLEFINNIAEDGVAIINGDSQNNRDVISKAQKKVITYGFSDKNDYQVNNLHFTEGKTSFDVKTKDVIIGSFNLTIPGKFNSLNAAAAIVAALHLGLSINEIQKGLSRFIGTKRRFELVYKKKGVKIYDDYAHHPNEIKNTLLAAKEWYPKDKIVCIFQPHTYSRTKALLNEFAISFGFADEVIILPIFASAREAEDKTINSSLMVNKISSYHQNVHLASDTRQLMKLISDSKCKSCIITMGAGDVYKLKKDLINSLKND